MAESIKDIMQEAHQVIAAERETKIRTNGGGRGQKQQSKEEGPISLPADEVEPFPVEALPAPLRRFVREAAEALPCPADFVALPMLAILGAAIGTSRVIEVKPGWQEGPRLFVMVVGDPGSRKSPALELAAHPLRQKQKALAAKFAQEMEKYGREISAFEAQLESWKLAKRRAAKSCEELPDKPREPERPVMAQAFSTDSTIEALGLLLSQNPRGLVYLQDELSGWVHSMGQYKKAGRGADRQAWLSFWNGASILINRKSNPDAIYLDDPFVAVVGCLPPDILGDLADERGREDGFIHRILSGFPNPEKPRWSDGEVSERDKGDYRTIYDRLSFLEPAYDQEGNLRPVVVPFSVRGKEVFIEFLENHHRDQADALFPENLRGPWAKLEGYFARLALIIQLAHWAAGEAGGEVIEERSATAAATLVSYFKSHARRIYRRLQISEEDKAAEQALKWINVQGGKASARDILKNHVAGIKNATQAKALLRDLADRGHGTIDDQDHKQVIFKTTTRRQATSEPKALWL